MPKTISATALPKFLLLFSKRSAFFLERLRLLRLAVAQLNQGGHFGLRLRFGREAVPDCRGRVADRGEFDGPFLVGNLDDSVGAHAASMARGRGEPKIVRTQKRRPAVTRRSEAARG